MTSSKEETLHIRVPSSLAKRLREVHAEERKRLLHVSLGDVVCAMLVRGLEFPERSV